MTKALIFDIEGTITDIRFVADVLFPYARAHMPAFLRAHADVPEVAKGIADVKLEIKRPDAALDEVIAQLDDWMARDVKIGPLKYLQGIVWRVGYETGAFKGHLYPEVPAALQHYKAQGLPLYIYSSGSVEAQVLLLKYSDFGDLTPLFSGHFDTTIGGKLEAQSYINIAQKIGLSACDITFFSDNIKELEAAKTAGMNVVELQREPTQSTPFIASQGWPVWSEILHSL